MKPYLRESKDPDIHSLSLTLRQGDRDEIDAVYDYTTEQAIRVSYDTSDICWTICDGVGNVIGMTGANRQGTIWMLCSEDFDDSWRWLARTCRDYIVEMYKLSPTLSNWVDVRNYKAIRLLKWCNFSLTEDMKLIGKDRIPFIRFIGYK